jgi:hypothetical protein
MSYENAERHIFNAAQKIDYLQKNDKITKLEAKR